MFFWFSRWDVFAELVLCMYMPHVCTVLAYVCIVCMHVLSCMGHVKLPPLMPCSERRGVAMHLANLCSFLVHEEIVQHLMAEFRREQLENYAKVSMAPL